MMRVEPASMASLCCLEAASDDTKSIETSKLWQVRNQSQLSKLLGDSDIAWGIVGATGPPGNLWWEHRYGQWGLREVQCLELVACIPLPR